MNSPEVCVSRDDMSFCNTVNTWITTCSLWHQTNKMLCRTTPFIKGVVHPQTETCSYQLRLPTAWSPESIFFVSTLPLGEPGIKAGQILVPSNCSTLIHCKSSICGKSMGFAHERFVFNYSAYSAFCSCIDIPTPGHIRGIMGVHWGTRGYIGGYMSPLRIPL